MRRAVLFGGVVVGGLLLLGGALFLGVFLGKGSGTGSSPKIPGFAEEKPGLGDTQNVGELSVTLVEAFRTEGDTEGTNNDDDMRSLLPPNGTFVVTRLRAQNGTPKAIVWNELYEFVAYSTDGRELTEAYLIRQVDPTAPREDHYLYDTDIRPGGDVTGTLIFTAELDEEVSVELVEGLDDRKPEAVWEFGPVGELPKREFKFHFSE